MLRIDYPTAIQEQLKEQLEAKKLNEIRTKEDSDALQYAHRLQEEEFLRRRNRQKQSPRKLAATSTSSNNHEKYDEITLESHSPPPLVHHERAHSSNSHSIEKDFAAKCSMQKTSSGGSFDLATTMTEARSFTSKQERLFTLRQLGLSSYEIEEIERKIEQELEDEALARKLQNESTDTPTVEELDRKLAMEAQDKEVAKMLYNRERAKLKKAKEKARLKREMRQQEGQQSFDGSTHSNEHPAESLRKYSKPPLPDPPEDHYVSPADMLSTKSCENIYLSPIDDDNLHLNLGAARSRQGFRLSDEVEHLYNQPEFPGKLDFYKTFPLINKTNFSFIDAQNPEPVSVPPYMPIQGTRRTSPIARKKKERCTQQ